MAIVAQSSRVVNPKKYVSGYTFRVCSIGPSGSYELPIGISPEAAARKDPAAFLRFADEVAREAEKLRRSVRKEAA
jgi:hypothetical protein